jgi:hypothetical protein
VGVSGREAVADVATAPAAALGVAPVRGVAVALLGFAIPFVTRALQRGVPCLLMAGDVRELDGDAPFVVAGDIMHAPGAPILGERKDGGDNGDTALVLSTGRDDATGERGFTSAALLLDLATVIVIRILSYFGCLILVVY